MDTQTTGMPANQGENKGNKSNKASKAAAAAAGVAAVGGLAASMTTNDESDFESLVNEVATEEPTDSTATAETTLAADTIEPATEAEPKAEPAAASAPQAPAPSPSEAALATESTAAPANEPVHTDAAHDTDATFDDIPVDEAWINPTGETMASAQQPAAEPIANPAPAPSDNLADNTQAQEPVMPESIANLAQKAVGDELADKVNVSPEIFMSMLHLKPTEMIMTELAGDGKMHNAALLADDNGNHFLLIDSDNDGFLDMVTDMDGQPLPSLGDTFQFEVSSKDMASFITYTSHQEFAAHGDSQHAEHNLDEIVSIEGDGDGDDVAYIDESDLNDDNTPSYDTLAANDAASVDNDLHNAFDTHDDDDEVTNIDLINYNDTSMA